MTQTPEQRREWEARNRGKLNEQARERYARNRDKQRAYQRAWREANRDKSNAQHRAWAARNSDKVKASTRAWREANRDRVSTSDRLRRMVRHHGMNPEEWAILWQSQEGRCYLCGENLDPSGVVVVEHDHSCCPRNRSCRICRRGLAHDNCNTTIGFAGDDPARLRRMADALEAAQLAIEQRKALAYRQPDLLEGLEAHGAC